MTPLGRCQLFHLYLGLGYGVILSNAPYVVRLIYIELCGDSWFRGCFRTAVLNVELCFPEVVNRTKSVGVNSASTTTTARPTSTSMSMGIRFRTRIRRAWRRRFAYQGCRCRFRYPVAAPEEVAAVHPMILDRAACWSGAFREVAAVPARDRAQVPVLAAAQAVALLMTTSVASGNSIASATASTSLTSRVEPDTTTC